MQVLPEPDSHQQSAMTDYPTLGISSGYLIRTCLRLTIWWRRLAAPSPVGPAPMIRISTFLQIMYQQDKSYRTFSGLDLRWTHISAVPMLLYYLDIQRIHRALGRLTSCFWR